MRIVRCRRMRTAAAVVVALSLCTPACNQNTSRSAAAPAASTGEAALKMALDAYVIEFLRRYPTVSTYLGGSGLDSSLLDVDGMLRDYSSAALEEEDRWLANT